MALVKVVKQILSQRCLARCLHSSSSNKTNEEYTHFGYESVKTEEKVHKVHDVFSKVASKYDVMNDVMSFGIHRLWKDRLMQVLNPDEKTVLLDCAGGTGDIAFRFMNYLRSSGCARALQNVTVCDINQDMLRVGEKRALDVDMDITWVCGSAEDLPFSDESFNAYTIAFGIRNCTYIDKVLKEAFRVLSPGGRFLCLEFSEVRNPIFKRLYDTYSFQIIPVMGEVIAGDWKSYQYLSESIRRFPNQKEFKHMIQQAGFKEVTYENLTNGVCAIHSGFKL